MFGALSPPFPRIYKPDIPHLYGKCVLSGPSMVSASTVGLSGPTHETEIALWYSMGSATRGKEAWGLLLYSSTKAIQFCCPIAGRTVLARRTGYLRFLGEVRCSLLGALAAATGLQRDLRTRRVSGRLRTDPSGCTWYGFSRNRRGVPLRTSQRLRNSECGRSFISRRCCNR